MACELNENTIPLDGNTLYEGHLDGFGDVVTYSFDMIENETITFNVNIINDSGSGTLPNATLILFKILDGNVINLGTSYLQSQVNVFNYDGVVGDYFFCLENVYSCNYSVLVEFTDYDGIVFTRMYSYSGESMDGEWPIVEIPPCNQEVSYEITNGKLPLDISNEPEDFTFESSGIIYGVPGEQDCESEDDETPSWNWKRYDSETGIHPLGKEYDFIIRAYFTKYPYVFIEKAFKICVFNNWDYDKPDLINLQRTEYDVSYVEVELPNQSPLCTPCTETKEIITERIINWKEYDIEGFLKRMDKLMYEKQCKERHELPKLDDVYREPEIIINEVNPCDVCPEDEEEKPFVSEQIKSCPICTE